MSQTQNVLGVCVKHFSKTSNLELRTSNAVGGPRTSNFELRTSLRNQLPPRVRVVGGPITPLDLEGTVALMMAMARCRERGYICVANVHTVTLAARDPQFKNVLDHATAVVADGMPVVWQVRRAGHPNAGRVYGVDLIHLTCGEGIPVRLRHGFLGGLEGVADAMVNRLQMMYPALQVAGTWNPGEVQNGEISPARLLETINRAQCDVLWVGLGAPKQELWMAKHHRYLNTPVLVGVGQAFDILSGRAVRPPEWMSGRGLEWLFRLVHEPRRLARRYLVYNSLFLFYLGLEWVGIHIAE